MEILSRVDRAISPVHRAAHQYFSAVQCLATNFFFAGGKSFLFVGMAHDLEWNLEWEWELGSQQAVGDAEPLRAATVH